METGNWNGGTGNGLSTRALWLMFEWMPIATRRRAASLGGATAVRGVRLESDGLGGYGIGGPGQVPPGPTSVSPCALCAGTALFDTVITTHGFFAECVR